MMKKNVRKSTPTKRRSASAQKRKSTKPSYGLWGSIAGICLLLVSGLWYASTTTSFHTLLARFHGNTTSSQVAHQKNPAKKTAIAENDSSTGPEFDFYQMLPNSKVETNTQPSKIIDKDTVENTTPVLQESPEGAPVENMTSPVATHEAVNEESKPITKTSSSVTPTKHTAAVAPKTAAPQKEYYLQIISLTNLKEADNYKAKLILAGYSPFMSKAYIRGNTWYRILVGPYDSPKEITLVKSELEKDHYKTLLIVDSEGKIHG